MIRLRELFEALAKAGLTLKPEKCKFGVDQVDFLGFRISAEGVKPGLNKVQAIEKFDTPEDLHEVRRFLGLSGFFRRFVPGYASIAVPLQKLTKQGVKFYWSSEHEKSFSELKDRLSSEPILG